MKNTKKIISKILIYFRRFVLSGSFVLDDQKFTDEHSGSVYDAASLDSF